MPEATQTTATDQPTFWIRFITSILWILSTAGFITGQFYLIHRRQQAGMMYLGIAALILLITSLVEKRNITSDPDVPSRISGFLVIMILLAAALLRAHKLDTIPFGAYNDEMVKGMDAINIINGARFEPFHSANKEFLYFYLVVPFIKFFGVNYVALRMVAVTAGIITVILQYILFRSLFGQPVGICAAAVLAVGIWPCSSSHISERLNTAPLAAIAAILMIHILSRTRRFIPWLLAGVVLAAGMWTFPTYRLIPFVAPVYLIYIAFRTPGFCRKNYWKACIGIAVYILVFSLPLKLDLVKTYHTFYTRVGHEFKITTTNVQIYENLSNLLKTFNYRFVGDMSFRLYDQPLFWWPIGALFLIGLLWVLIRLEKPATMLLILWLGAGILPAVVSIPEIRRLTGVQPLVFGLIGIGLYRALSGISAVIRWRRAWLLLPALILVSATGFRTWDVLYNEIGPKWCISKEDYGMVRMAVGAFPFFDVRMDWIEEEAELPYRYLTYPYTKDFNYYTPLVPKDSIPFKIDPTKDLLYLFRNIQENRLMLPLIKAYYPMAVLSLHKDKELTRGFYSLMLSKSDLMEIRGLRALYRSVDGTTQNAHLTQSLKLRFPDDFPENLQAPISCEYTGGLLVSHLGDHAFAFESPPHSTIWIDEEKVAEMPDDQESIKFHRHLLPGLHHFTLSSPAIQNGDQISLIWETPPDPKKRYSTEPRERSVIPAQHLIVPPIPELALPSNTQKPAGFQYQFVTKTSYRNEAMNRFYDPSIVKCLPDGRIIAANWHNRVIMVLSEQGELQTIWDPNVLSDHQFDLRYRIDISDDQMIYLIGSRNQGMLVFDTDGNLKRKVPLPLSVRDIACAPEGDCYLLAPSTIYRISGLDGQIKFSVDVRGQNEDEFWEPEAITSDKNGNIYLFDPPNRRLFIYDSTGKFNRSFPFPCPIEDTLGLTIDGRGNIYIPNVIQNRVFVFNPEGCLLTGDEQHEFDPLDSLKVPRPRYITFSPDLTKMYIGNSESGIYMFEKIW